MVASPRLVFAFGRTQGAIRIQEDSRRIGVVNILSGGGVASDSRVG